MANRLLIIEKGLGSTADIEKRYRKKKWQVEKVATLDDGIKMVIKDDISPHVVCVALSQKIEQEAKQVARMEQELEHSDWVFFVDGEKRIEKANFDDVNYHYVEKPFEQKHVDMMIERALRTSLTARRLEAYSAHQFKQNQLDAYLGASKQVTELKDMLAKIAEVPISSMIVAGETGTGKGLVARILHHTGLRKNGPLIELNCAAIPRDLLESQLFGHEAGAFTGAKVKYRGLFEQADNGTLFLDEIGDMDIDLQAKVLKAIEDKKIRRLGGEREIEVDVQIIAASAKDLESASKEKSFREDLYHRLSVFCVSLPPLRTRKSDLVELVPSIIAEFNAIAGKTVETVSDEVWQKLLDYDWPGNVRELRNVIERCVLMSSGEDFPVDWLQLKSECVAEATVEDINENRNKVTLPIDGSMALEEMDGHIIQTALRDNDYNITETARVLKTTRETIRYRIQKYELDTSA